MSRVVFGFVVAFLLWTGLGLAQAPPAAPPDPEKKPAPASDKPAADKPAADKPEGSKPADKPAAEKKSDDLLRYKFAKGDVLRYRIKTELTQQQKIETATRRMSLVREDVVASTVDELDDKGFAHFKQRIVQLGVNAKFDGQAFHFDSRSAADNDADDGKPLNALYERLAGGEIQLLVGPQGDVAEARGYAELLRDVIAGNPLAMQCAGGGTNNALRVAAEEQTVIFGDKVVKAGEKWIVPIDLESPALGRARGRRVYTLVGPDKVGKRSTLRINILTELAFDLDLDNNGVRLSGRMTSYEANGVAQFDKQAGRLISLKVGYKMAGKLTAVVKDKSTDKEQTTEIEDDQTHSLSVDWLDTLPN